MGKIIPPTKVLDDWTPSQRTKYYSNPDVLKVDGHRTIDASNLTKNEYIIQTFAACEKDLNRIQQFTEKRAQIQQMLDDSWFIDREKLTKRLQNIDEKIAKLQEDLAFNQQNILNTIPPGTPPPIPIPPPKGFVNAGTQITCMTAIPLASSMFSTSPTRTVFLEGSQMGNIMDFQPMVCIPCMGQCVSMINPTVASATAAACGALTPMPCIPSTASPWIMGQLNVLVEGQPALLQTDKLMCSFAGTLTIQPSPILGSGSSNLSKEYYSARNELLDDEVSLLKQLGSMLGEEGLNKLIEKYGDDFIKKFGKMGMQAGRAGATKIPLVGLLFSAGFYAYDELSGNNSWNAKSIADVEKNHFERARQWEDVGVGQKVKFVGKDISDYMTGYTGSANKTAQDALEGSRDSVANSMKGTKIEGTWVETAVNGGYNGVVTAGEFLTFVALDTIPGFGASIVNGLFDTGGSAIDIGDKAINFASEKAKKDKVLSDDSDILEGDELYY